MFGYVLVALFVCVSVCVCIQLCVFSCVEGVCACGVQGIMLPLILSHSPPYFCETSSLTESVVPDSPTLACHQALGILLLLPPSAWLADAARLLLPALYIYWGSEVGFHFGGASHLHPLAIFSALVYSFKQKDDVMWLLSQIAELFTLVQFEREATLQEKMATSFLDQSRQKTQTAPNIISAAEVARHQNVF